MQISFRNIPIEVTRKRIRSLRLRIKEDGSVHLSLPLFTSDADAERFLIARYIWIVEMRSRMLANQVAPLQFVTGDSLPFLGQIYTLHILPTPIGNAVAIEGNQVVMRCKSDASTAFKRAIWENFCKKQLAAILTQMVSEWGDRLQEKSISWSVRNMRTAWGSCTPRRRTMRFNLRLIEKALEHIEYVVVHELTHLQVPNHGADFKRLMTERMPDWQRRKKELNATSSPF